MTDEERAAIRGLAPAPETVDWVVDELKAIGIEVGAAWAETGWVILHLVHIGQLAKSLREQAAGETGPDDEVVTISEFNDAYWQLVDRMEFSRRNTTYPAGEQKSHFTAKDPHARRAR